MEHQEDNPTPHRTDPLKRADPSRERIKIDIARQKRKGEEENASGVLHTW